MSLAVCLLPFAQSHPNALPMQEGYRTLCVAYKRLNAEAFAQADASLREARLALQDREEKLLNIYDQLETGMNLIGATAVEDRSVPY